MYNKICLLISALFIMANFSYSQVDISYVLKPGISTVKISNPAYSQKYNISGETGFRFNIKTNELFSITSGIMYNRIEGLEEHSIVFTDENGQPIGGENTLKYSRHINYFGIPVLFAINTNKWQFKMGIQSLILISGTYQLKADPININGQIFEWNDKSKLEAKNYDIGLVNEISYKLNKRLSLNYSLYLGLNDISKSSSMQTWKIQQILLGVEYNLFENLLAAKN